MEKIKENEIIVEDTTVANAANIATTDENVSIESIFQQGAMPSLAKQIFSVAKISGPTAALFNIRKKSGSDEFTLLRAEVEVYPSKSINTGLSLETIEDLRSQYGKEADQIVGKLLRGLANDGENEKTIAFLESKCLSESALVLTDSSNAETNLFEITQRVQELVLKANSKNIRTYEAFCVLPYKLGASISTLSKYASDDNSTERGLFLAEIGQTKYYLNPNSDAEKIYVGLKESKNLSKSSAVFTPDQENIITAQDPDSGETVFFIINRFGITASPLHELGNEMLFKFEVTL
jgi:hypothetical protein